jgi:hypothetical protein
MLCMNPVLGLAHQTGVRLAEVGFLLMLFAGVWLAAAHIAWFKLSNTRSIVAGVALAIGGLLLIIATHWGHFG